MAIRSRDAREDSEVHEIDAISAIHAQLALLTKKLDATNVIQTLNPPYDAFVVGQPANEGQVATLGSLQPSRQIT